jgi:hypothetical protein
MAFQFFCLRHQIKPFAASCFFAFGEQCRTMPGYRVPSISRRSKMSLRQANFLNKSYHPTFGYVPFAGFDLTTHSPGSSAAGGDDTIRILRQGFA